MIKVYLQNLPLYIFSLIINLLIVEVYPFQAIAQNKASEPAIKQAANVTQSALEPKILSEINRVRTNPQGYAQWLEEQRQYYDGIWLKLPGERPIRTNKGLKALEEAIAVLKEQQPLSPLDVSQATSATATNKLEDFATATNIQHISYGRVTPKGIVMSLVVDELFPDRRRRKNLLSPDANDTGVVCQPDPRYAKVCAIAYSDTESTTEVAQTKPENAANSPTDTIAAQPETPVPPKDEANTTNAIETAPTAPTKPETPVPSEKETIANEPEEEQSNPQESSAAEESDSESETVAESLPQPPQPQTPINVPEIEPPTSENEEIEAEDDVQDEGSEVTEAETEELEDIEAEEIEQNEDAAELAEIEAEAEELANNEEEREAENSDNEAIIATNSSGDRILESVKKGTLEQGDSTIPDDGSFYDSYPMEVKSGDSFTINLESDEFDPFVALIDNKGNIIEQNDDISEEDSNSQIKVTIPEDGSYNVIVNAYDEGGKGEYVLTVSE